MAIIPERTYVQPRDAGPTLPQGAFNATTRATANLIGVIGGSVDEALKWANKAQDIRNDSDIRERARGMREAHANFLQEIQGDPQAGIPPLDPAEWGSVWQNRLSQMQEKYRSEDTPPAVKRAVEQQFDEFAGRSYLSLADRAFKETRRRAYGNLMLDADELASAEDFEGSRKLIEDGIESGVVDPIDGRAKLQKLDKKEQQTDLDYRRQDDPIEYKRQLEEGEIELPPRQKQIEIEKAEYEANSQEAAALRRINEEEEIEPAGSEEEFVQRLEMYPELDENTRKLAVKSWKENQPLDLEERQIARGKMRKIVNDFKYGRMTFDQYEKEYIKVAKDIEALGSRDGTGPLKNRLYHMDPTHLDPEGMREEEKIKERAKALETPMEFGEDLIRQRVNGVEDEGLAKFDFETDTPDGRVDKVKKTDKAKEYSILLTEAMEVKLAEYIQSRYPEIATKKEIFEMIDEIQVQAVSEVDDFYTRPTPAEEEEILKAEAKAKAERLRAYIMSEPTLVMPEVPDSSEISPLLQPID